MGRWAIANLNRGELDSKRILEESSYDLLFEPWRDSQKNGVGWFHGEHRGFRTVYHGGHDTGFRSYIALLPEKSLGVVGSSNFDQVPLLSIAKAALDVMLGFDPTIQR
jgi:CubicO group peptidase (beta-lactamase class C family)